MNTRRLVIAMDGGLIQDVSVNFLLDADIVLLEYDVDGSPSEQQVRVPQAHNGKIQYAPAFLSTFKPTITDPQIDNFLQERSSEP